MYSRKNLCFFICTVCIAKVILSSNVTDETNATTTTASLLTTSSPSDEPRTTLMTNETDATTTTINVSTTLRPTDKPVTDSVTNNTNTAGISFSSTIKLDSSDEDDVTTAQTDSVDSVAVQTSSRVSTLQVAKSTLETTTLEPATTLVPSTEAPFSLECRDDLCPNQERCLVRQAASGPDHVCECALEIGSTYGFDCRYTYAVFFRSTVPLTTCYGLQCATGSQSSPNYPDNYNDTTGQMTVVYVPGAYRFDLSFDDGGIDIEEIKDHLLIGGGFRPPFDNPTRITEEIDTFQGVRYISGDVTPENFSIYNDSMWIWFQTDFNINRKGFNVSWRSVAIDVECPEDTILILPDDSDHVKGGWTPTIHGAGVGIENLKISSNYDPDYNFTVGSYGVEYQFRDIFNNKAECKFRLTVRDVTRPVVACPENVELQTCNRSEAVWIKPTASDNSGEMVTEEIQIINRRSDSIQRGRNTVVHTFSDRSGNTQECRFEVNIVCDLDALPNTSGVEFWVILAVAAGVIGLLLLIIALFALVKQASIKDANKADLSFNPEDFQGPKPGAPLEEEEETLPKGNEKTGMYEFNSN